MFLKTKLFLLATILFLLWLPSFSTKALLINCSTNQFSDGSTSKTITFPPGGGTNTDAKVRLPIGAKITCASVDLTPTTLIRTPYIWIPNSGDNTLAQIRTGDGTLVQLYQNGINGFPANAFSNNSRITVIPGGDVYVANRGNQYITRLTPQPAPSELYNYGGQLDMGAGVNWIRAVTFDKNGYVWGGTCGSAAGDKIRVFCGLNTGCGAFDTVLATLNNGKCHYGAIGDKYGFVWTVGSGEIRSYIYSAGTITEIDLDSVPGSYGIGIDNDANIWIGDWSAPMGVHKVNRDATGNITSVESCSPPATAYCSGLSANSGVAVDGTTPLGNVWVAGYSTNQVSRFRTDGTFVANYDAGATPHGVAIDFDNNAWVVNLSGGSPPGQPVLNPSGCAAGAGSVTKYDSNGNYIATYTTCGNGPYNYSDMTGFRSIPISFSLGSFSTTASNSATTTITGWGPQLQAALVGCTCTGPSPGPSDDCQVDPTDTDYCIVPLSIYSVTGGEFILDNLQICCGLTVPSTFGGLVPCGRNENNPATPWNEQEPCTVCHFFLMLKFTTDFVVKIAAVVGLLFLILSGLFYASASGDLQRLQQAKSMFIWVLAGLGIVLLAWLLVTIVLTVLGYIHPLGGVWNFIC